MEVRRRSRIIECVAGVLAALTLVATSAIAQQVRIIDRFAGGSNGDGGPALGASMEPIGVAADGDGNVFVADQLSNSVRRIDAVTGVISLVAGNGGQGATGDGGPATEATLRGPSDVDVDDDGNIYIVDRGNHKIRRVDGTTGIITTVAGTGTAGFSGDGGAATGAQFNNPTSIALDGEGGFFVSDVTNDRIRQVFAGGGIRTYAGNGETGSTGDGGPATNARLGRPWGIGLDDDGNLYFAELLNQRIRVVYAQDETIDTFAGTGSFDFCDNVHRSEACFRNPTNVDYHAGTNAVLISDTGNHRIRSVSLDTDLITTIAGGNRLGGFPFGFEGDGGLAINAKMRSPAGVASHPTLGVYIADQGNLRIRQIFADATIDTIAGNGNLPSGGDGGPALSSKLNGPAALTTNAQGNVYITDVSNHRIRVVDASGIIETLAGNGEAGYNGDNIQATQAQLNAPTGVAAADDGTVYIADTTNNRVRVVSTSGIIDTVLGDGASESDGDGGRADLASSLRPQGIAYWQNASGSEKYLYVVEPLNQVVRRVDLNANRVIRFAGNGQRGFSGDGGAATNAKLALPLAVATNPAGDLFIADAGNHRIRKVSNGTITTVAGNGAFAYSGDGGLAISASLALPDGVAIGPLGNLWINDSANLRIRVVKPDGIIQTAAGTGTQTSSIDGEDGNPLDNLGNGGPSVLASFSQPSGVAADADGNVYIADSQADTVRWVEDLSTLFESAPMNEISGQVRHATTFQAIPDVSVDFIGPTPMDPIMTASNGSFSATELSGSTWLVEPSKSGGFGADAVGPLDVSYVLQFLVNTRDLTAAQQLACDVTGDGTVSPFDASEIMQRALQDPPFDEPFNAADVCKSDFHFLPNADPALNQTEIVPMLQGGNTCQKGAIQYSPLAGQPDGQDFQAIVIGDCTGNWRAGGVVNSLAALSTRRGRPSAVVLGPTRQTRRRLRIPVSISGNADFSAFELHLDYDPAVLRPIKPRTRGVANGSMIAWREPVPGELRLAIAKGSPMSGPARALVVVDFEILSRSGRPNIEHASAFIDESPAPVSFKRRRRR